MREVHTDARVVGAKWMLTHGSSRSRQAEDHNIRDAATAKGATSTSTPTGSASATTNDIDSETNWA
jgi:hypothetical protein